MVVGGVRRRNKKIIRKEGMWKGSGKENCVLSEYVFVEFLLNNCRSVKISL